MGAPVQYIVGAPFYYSDYIEECNRIFSMFSPVLRCFFRCDRPPVQAQFTLRLRFTGKPDRGMMYSLMISFVTVQLLSFQ